MAALAAASFVGLLLALAPVVGADTDAAAVAALGNLYTSWNSPAQLAGWSAAAGGDPCGAAWMGVTCSGSAITAINLSGMGLNGTLGYLLSNLVALKTMDLSNNNLHDTIPYQLPPNLIHLNLARNNFSGNLPYSISNMISLGYLNVSHNSLLQEIGELFGNLNSLSKLDLSFNHMSGNLPASFVSLSNLSSLYMQNNQLSGTVSILGNLSLTTLNVENNNFSGLIPGEFSSIPNLIVGGNSFINMPASPPPIVMPPSQSPLDQPDHPQGPMSFPDSPDPKIPIDQGDKKQGRQTGVLVGLVVASVAAASCVLFALLFCLHTVHKGKDGGTSEPKEFVGALAVNIDRAAGIRRRGGVGSRAMSSSTNSTAAAESAVAKNGANVEALPFVNDKHGGVIIEMTAPMDPQVFSASLKSALSKWREQGIRGVWIKLPIGLANLIPSAVEEGFWYHHAEETYLMLAYWLLNTTHTLPVNATHRVGVGAFVMNDKREVLAVQEKSGVLRGLGVWKFPTGVVEPGEDINIGAVREVKEETGIDTEFIEVVAFRQSHKAYFDKSDLFFVCILRPLSFDITKQESEIEDAQWIPVEEFAAQPFVQKHELVKYILKVGLAKVDKEYAGFSPILIKSAFTDKQSLFYMNKRDLDKASGSGNTQENSSL